MDRVIADYIWHLQGNKEWFLQLDSVFAKELNKTKERDFMVKGDKAGSLISVGAGAGNYTFLEVYEAGHMVSSRNACMPVPESCYVEVVDG